MRRALIVPLSIGLLTALAVGCTAAGDRVDDVRTVAGELRGNADQVRDDAGFCLSLTRAAAAIESGSPAIAEEATEEALARAPEEVVDDARAVAEAVRKARDEGEWSPHDPELTDAVERLAENARDSCTPG
jgi:hypothetical protein